MNEINFFKNEEFGEIRTTIINEEPWFVGHDLANALGYKNQSDALSKHVSTEDKQVIQKSQITTLENIPNRGLTFVNESGLYALILGSKLESAKKFKQWVTGEVLPTIRKTGGYVNNEELFVNTYLPFADENTKLMFSQTLETVRKQNELIKKQQEEILHKQEVINGFTEDIDIYKKKDIINRICKRRSGNYASRYKELYKCFKETNHIDLEARCSGYNLKQTKKSNKLSVIKYAEKFGFIDDLYSCCAKLYETEVNEVINSLKAVQE